MERQKANEISTAEQEINIYYLAEPCFTPWLALPRGRLIHNKSRTRGFPCHKKQRSETLCNTTNRGTTNTTTPWLRLKFLGAENASHMSGCPQGSGVIFCTNKTPKRAPRHGWAPTRIRLQDGKHLEKHLETSSPDQGGPCKDFHLLGPTMHLLDCVGVCTAGEDQDPWTCRSPHSISEIAGCFSPGNIPSPGNRAESVKSLLCFLKAHRVRTFTAKDKGQGEIQVRSKPVSAQLKQPVSLGKSPWGFTRAVLFLVTLENGNI